MVHTYEIEFGGRKLTIETGKLAGQADGAVTVRFGDTIVLSAVTGAREPREGADFFPLTVDYEERTYAAGKIPGNVLRREGRPSEEAILTMRLTDRPLRPLFPKDFRNEVQIINTALSWDGENDPDVLCILGASAALTISPIPFDGPCAAVRVGRIGGKFVLNPTRSQQTESDLDLVVAGTADAVNMLEAGAKEVPEDVVVEAINWGHQQLQPLIELQNKMRSEIGRPKFEYPSFAFDPELERRVRDAVGRRIEVVLDTTEKHARANAAKELVNSVAEVLGDEVSKKDIAAIIDEIEAEELRKRILGGGKRPDGRDLKELRPISAEVGILPRAHGSGLFQRGQTQVLSIVTLGSTADEQNIGIDELEGDSGRRYIHHYNMPPYSVGEVRRTGSPGRREIGHGALARRALEPVVPPQEQFPYTIRVVSEVVSSNGSTSMGSVCGSTLALMDAGVPIKAPVAGISIGWVHDDGKNALLTDIQGIEDHHGDMDFKVAGTHEGVTAVQLDLKARGLPSALLPDIFARAREARLFILERMSTAIAEVRPELSQFAPRVLKTSIPVDRIGQLIGPGGKNIRGLQDQYKVKIDVEEDGTVYIAGSDGPAAERALQAVSAMGRDVEVGQTYMGKVVRITNFGAFVEILPGKDGLVRLGELSEERVNRVEDVVSLGDEIMVKVIEIDPQGRVNLSRRAVLAGDDYVAAERPARGEGGGRFGDRGRRDGGGYRGGRDGSGYRGGREGGGVRDRDRGPREERSHAESGSGSPAPPRPRQFRAPPPGFGGSAENEGS